MRSAPASGNGPATAASAKANAAEAHTPAVATTFQGGAAYGTGSKVVLTTAHLNHQPEDCRDENLRSMCQGCHLHYDRKHHAESRRRTQEQRTGQRNFLAEA